MTQIQQFIKIRCDGKIIDETMKVEDIFALGTPEKIIEIRWCNGSQSVSFRNAHGLLAKVVPGRQFVAAIADDESRLHGAMLIFNADGTQRLKLSNTQVINGKSELGEFCWFESPRVESLNVFGVIFSLLRCNLQFQLDIDAENGNVVGVYLTR